MKGKIFIGAATSAHQVEGNNIHSDCWAQEHMVNTAYVEPSGIACDHYNRYEEDIKLMADAGLNAYRFSIEWARIEPEKGKYQISQIDHYREVIKCCFNNGIEPIVTLHHFSSPKWLIDEGGWENEEVISYFGNYAKYVVTHLGQDINYICTINELNMGLQMAALTKRYMKQMNIQLGVSVDELVLGSDELKKENIEVFGTDKVNSFISLRSEAGDIFTAKAHVRAREEIKKLYPQIKVGMSLSLHDLQLGDDSDEAKSELKQSWDDEFLHYLPYMEGDDFLGVQNYTREIIGKEGVLPVTDNLTQMNYENYPQAIGNVVSKVAEQFKGELIITENGIATTDDNERIEFINSALTAIENCINNGINVKGYLYWSLLDNFEWQRGYSMQFGLIEVDRKTQKRNPKGSLSYLGQYLD